MKKLSAGLFVLVTLVPCIALAQEPSPAGLWRNIDDTTGKAKALIRVTEHSGEFSGRIEKIFPEPGEDPNPKCDKCEGTLKGQPNLGMTIMSGFRLDGTEYGGGTILDPENGKYYKSKMSLADGGKKLNVRGYVGIPLFGRSQTWLREQ
jgi:uncharacterized protein (DUF2147 family)